MEKNTFFAKCIRHTGWLMQSISDFVSFLKVVDKGTYVFISHNADIAGGAPVVLFELVRKLDSKYKVIFLSEKPGPIIAQCREEKIPAFIFYGFRNMFLKKSVNSQVKAIVINTMALYKCVNYLNRNISDIKVIWWLHEEHRIIERLGKQITKQLNDNIKILAVSDRVKSDFSELLLQHKKSINVVYYGCNDMYHEERKQRNRKNKFEIIVIGRICERKNQLQVIKAYGMLPQSIRESIYIKFVAGSQDEIYKMQILEEIRKKGANDVFSFIGPIQRTEMSKIYMSADLLICPSLDDPLPVVVTEAMMLKCPFITSSHTGQYKIINDGYNGFVYDVNSCEELAQKIQKVLEIKDLSTILSNARLTYKEYFIPEVMSKNFEKELGSI